MIPKHIFEWQPELDRLMEHVAQITQWERLAGSEEEKRAFDYLEVQARKCGAAVSRLEHDAYISLPQAASLSVGGESFPCQTHSMVISTPEDGIKLELMYLPNGKADLTHTDVRGKLVMVSGRAVGGTVMQAQRAGVGGVIFMPEDHIYETCVSDIWGSPTLDEVDKLPRIPVVSVVKTTGDAIRARMESGKTEALLYTKVLTEWRKIPLLTAEIKCAKQAEPFVMFSGHVDSWYYGATDNAAANAVMLETLRLAAERSELLQRNLRIVFFSGHSHGRYAGSAWYSDAHWEDIHQNCCLNVNADVLGGLGAADVTRAVTMTEVKPLVACAVKAVAGADFGGKRYARHADQSFWGAGVSSALASFSKQPVMAQSGGAFSRPVGGPADLGWWWHTPADTIDKIDPHNFRRDARIFAAIVLHAATSVLLPLDFTATAKELEEMLQSWQAKAGELFDLSVPLKKVKALRERLAAYEASRPGLREGAADAFNRAMLRLERSLVPLNYTQGKLYENDSPANLPPLPALKKIDQLAALDEAGRKFLCVELIRRRSYVIDALNQAIEALDEYLKIEGGNAG